VPVREEMVAVMEPQEIGDEEHGQILEWVAVDVAKARRRWCAPGQDLMERGGHPRPEPSDEASGRTPTSNLSMRTTGVVAG
jgi:hypothetical protein